MKIGLYMLFSFILLICLYPLILFASYGDDLSNIDSIKVSYSNPVFELPMADPSVIYDKEAKKFYAYATADNWSDGKGVRLVPIIESSNLVDWKYVGTAFDKSSKPAWKHGGLWAPDIVKVNNKYHLYYSISVWSDRDPCIGVAISDNAFGPFHDKGKIFCSEDIKVPNSIDPFFYEENGTKYLFWGSYSNQENQGIHGVELSKDGLEIPNKESKFKIAAGDWEAVVIHKRNNYYYMIGSKGSCCAGISSTYHVLVGRSKSIKGPYLDKNGHKITDRGNGTEILRGNNKIVGPGHTSRIITEKDGRDWILYHGIQFHYPKLSNGINRRVLFVDEVKWVDDWPIVHNGEPSDYDIEKPNFD